MIPKVLIIDMGSQYTLVIARTLRELGVRSVVLPPARARVWLRSHPVRAIILSGGPASVYDHDAPCPPSEVFTKTDRSGRRTPVLGICFGMQWMVHDQGGEVKPELAHREYGQTELHALPSALFEGTPEFQSVWASHGDSVVKLPDGFEITAYSVGGGIAAIENPADQLYGVQFHPEVADTPHGKQILANFLRLAECGQDWQPSSMIQSIRADTVKQLKGARAVFGFSGGVDSTTLAAILAPVLGHHLLAVTIDGGHLREGEIDEIRRHAEITGVDWKVVDARAEFEKALSNVTDAEEKRQRFKRAYTAILKREAAAFGASCIVQGTLATDRIESGATGGALIKSHHNVGNNFGELRQLHPLGDLFKYEVRALAQELGLPESVWGRQPFPGPGLIIRIVGTPAVGAMLELVRWADARVTEILKKRGLYSELSQLVVAYVDVKTVGVRGDSRAYLGAVVVRAVKTIDFMTADGVDFPKRVKDEITSVLTRHRHIGRVWWDVTQKPPATTELE